MLACLHAGKAHSIEKARRQQESEAKLQEKKRKLFVHDDNVTGQVRSDMMKRQEKSIFSHANRQMAKEDLDPIVELYAAGKTARDDGESDDLLMVIAPGPPPNAPSTKNLELIHKRLRAIKMLISRDYGFSSHF